NWKRIEYWRKAGRCCNCPSEWPFQRIDVSNLVVTHLFLLKEPIDSKSHVRCAEYESRGGWQIIQLHWEGIFIGLGESFNSCAFPKPIPWEPSPENCRSTDIP